MRLGEAAVQGERPTRHRLRFGERLIERRQSVVREEPVSLGQPGVGGGERRVTRQGVLEQRDGLRERAATLPDEKAAAQVKLVSRHIVGAAPQRPLFGLEP